MRVRSVLMWAPGKIAGKAVLLVTPQPRLLGLADQVIRLDNGQVTIASSDPLPYQRVQWTTSSNGRRLGLTRGRSGRSAGYPRPIR